MKNMNFHILVVMGLTLGLANSSTVQAQNLLANPDFEIEDVSGGDLPVEFPGEWTAFYSPESNVTQRVQAQSGVQTLALHTWVMEGGAGAYQNFAATAGETYEASVWARSDSSDPLSGGSFAFTNIEFWDALNPVVNVDAKLLEVPTPNITSTSQPQDEWVEHKITATAPAGTVSVTYLMIFVQLGDGANPSAVVPGPIFFDNASLMLVESSTLDGDFDDNGQVDGSDFLLWQRNPGVGDLSDWESNFGVGVDAVSSVSAVPEPATATLILFASLAVCSLSRNFRTIV